MLGDKVERCRNMAPERVACNLPKGSQHSKQTFLLASILTPAPGFQAAAMEDSGIQAFLAFQELQVSLAEASLSFVSYKGCPGLPFLLSNHLYPSSGPNVSFLVQYNGCCVAFSAQYSPFLFSSAMTLSPSSYCCVTTQLPYP